MLDLTIANSLSSVTVVEHVTEVGKPHYNHITLLNYLHYKPPTQWLYWKVVCRP